MPGVAVHTGERYVVAESDRLRLIIDRTTGWLAELTDRASGTTLTVPGGAPHAVVLDDPGDTWAHGIARFEHVAGAFTPLGVRVQAAGPVRAIVRIESAFGSSTLTEELVLDAGASLLEVRVTLDWQERRRVLKLRAPVALEAPVATFSVPFGHVERPAGGGEEPGQAWVDVTGRLPGGGPAGLAVACDVKGAWDIDGASIGITAARSPAYAWHDPAPLDPDRPVTWQDQGRQRFRYALVPHAGSWRDAAVPRQAAGFLAPPVTLLEGTHAGLLPASGSFASLGPAGVDLAALKLAEDGSGDIIVRLVECHGTGARAVLDLPVVGRRCEVTLRPFEVQTLRVPRQPGAPVLRVDLLER
jgi:alpha-mannosidase